jgi:ERCC4-type nuclease
MAEQNTSLWIDYRERQILNAIPGSQESNLELGDVQLRKGDCIAIIIERKTISDLAASIKDNRYKEQKSRLFAFRGEHPLIRIVYIIEGFYSFDESFKCAHMSNKVLSSAIINTMLRDGIFIVMTKNVGETVSYIKALRDRFDANPDMYMGCLSNAGTSVDYAQVVASNVKTKKKDNIDVDACFIMQMSCIPGISAKKASDIAHHLGINTIHKLIDHITNNGGVKCLTNVPGIGKGLANIIMEYVMGEKN